MFYQDFMDVTIFFAQVIVALSCCTYGIVGYAVQHVEFLQNAYKSCIFYPDVDTFALMMVAQTIMSLMADYVMYDWQLMKTTSQPMMFMDNVLASSIAFSMALNVFALPIVDILICATLGMLSLILLKLGRVSAKQNRVVCYAIFHSLWHCLPFWWLAWLASAYNHKTTRIA